MEGLGAKPRSFGISSIKQKRLFTFFNFTNRNLDHGLSTRESKDSLEVALSQPGPFLVAGHEACDTTLTQMGPGTGYYLQQRKRVSQDR